MPDEAFVGLFDFPLATGQRKRLAEVIFEIFSGISQLHQDSSPHGEK